MGHLVVSKYEFSMIKIDFDPQLFGGIKDVSNSIIVLWNADGLRENSIVPSFVVVTADAYKGEIVSQGGLVNIHIAVRVPFSIVSPWISVVR